MRNKNLVLRANGPVKFVGFSLNVRLVVSFVIGCYTMYTGPIYLGCTLSAPLFVNNRLEVMGCTFSWVL